MFLGDLGHGNWHVWTPGSNLSGDKLLNVTSGGKLIVAGGNGNGYPAKP